MTFLHHLKADLAGECRRQGRLRTGHRDACASAWTFLRNLRTGVERWMRDDLLRNFGSNRYCGFDILHRAGPRPNMGCGGLRHALASVDEQAGTNRVIANVVP
jgi:hypothetical protein